MTPITIVFVRRLALETNAFAAADDGGKRCGGNGRTPSPSSDAAALDSPDDLLATTLATLDDEVYADRLKVQCKRTHSNPTTPTAADDDRRYPVRPPS